MKKKLLDALEKLRKANDALVNAATDAPAEELQVTTLLPLFYSFSLSLSLCVCVCDEANSLLLYCRIWHQKSLKILKD
jgi:hypothetical protein